MLYEVITPGCAQGGEGVGLHPGGTEAESVLQRHGQHGAPVRRGRSYNFV